MELIISNMNVVVQHLKLSICTAVYASTLLEDFFMKLFAVNIGLLCSMDVRKVQGCHDINVSICHRVSNVIEEIVVLSDPFF